MRRKLAVAGVPFAPPGIQVCPHAFPLYAPPELSSKAAGALDEAATAIRGAFD